MTILWSLGDAGAHPREFTDLQYPAGAFPEVRGENVLSDILFHFPRETGESGFLSPGTAKDETSASDFA
jgi:hypothetical protein